MKQTRPGRIRRMFRLIRCRPSAKGWQGRVKVEGSLAGSARAVKRRTAGGRRASGRLDTAGQVPDRGPRPTTCLDLADGGIVMLESSGGKRVQHDVPVRLLAFVSVLGSMAALEVVLPWRPPGQSRVMRWTGNLGLVILGAVLVRLVLPTSAVGLAALGEQRGWGLLGELQLPLAIACAIGVLLLDLAIYLQHVLFHAVPALWRLHRVHHADLELDATTGVRFHPIELLLSAGIKCGVVVALGPPAVAVVLFEVLLNATSMFNHANVRLPVGLDRFLRWLIVTPAMHRVHHSTRKHETNSNFGFSSPWWDRLLGTYRERPELGEDMVVGLDELRDPAELRLDRLLTQPFRKAAAVEGGSAGGD